MQRGKSQPVLPVQHLQAMAYNTGKRLTALQAAGQTHEVKQHSKAPCCTSHHQPDLPLSKEQGGQHATASQGSIHRMPAAVAASIPSQANHAQLLTITPRSQEECKVSSKDTGPWLQPADGGSHG